MRKSDFVCNRCGECCRHFVLLTKQDIGRIKKAGFKEQDFIRESPYEKGKRCIKIIDDGCFFLAEKKGKTFCRIYDQRPRVCRDYPSFKKEMGDCRPKNVFSKPG